MTDQLLRQQVTKFCADIGRFPLLVQGAGGNASWKDDGLLWIKASGMWLGDALTKEIFVPVDLAEVTDALALGEFIVAPKSATNLQLRPSIETLLHAIMPQRIVVHLHAIDILACLVRKKCDQEITERMIGLDRYVIVDYFKPGAELAAAVMAGLSRVGRANIVFMKSHGVVIGGESVDEVENVLKNILSRFSVDPVADESMPSCAPAAPGFSLEGYCEPGCSDVQNLALIPCLYDRLGVDWLLYPDHVVFMGLTAKTFDDVNHFLNYISSNSRPDLVFIKGQGVWCLESGLTKAKLEQLRCYYDVLSRQQPGTELVSLSANQVRELLNWDAEQYRVGLAK